MIRVFCIICLIALLCCGNSCKDESEIIFPIPEYSSVTDIDGNAYTTVRIGDQWWMAQNLKTTRYSDGTLIPMETDDTKWWQLRTDAYCLYENDPGSKTKFGVLYNGYAVQTGKLCPAGWHVPTHPEWKTMVSYLVDNGYGYKGSGYDVAKALAAKTDWRSYSAAGTPGNDLPANNSSGFYALPGGFRDFDGIFNYVYHFGFWWSSTLAGDYPLLGTFTTIYLKLDFSNSDPVINEMGYIATAGMSVRCIKE